MRRTAKTKKPKAKKTSASAAPTSTSAPAKSTQSKADFVRSRQHLSPKEIVEDAKAAGFKFDAHYVYNVRGADKAKTKVTKLAARQSTVKTAPPCLTSTTSPRQRQLHFPIKFLG